MFRLNHCSSQLHTNVALCWASWKSITVVFWMVYQLLYTVAPRNQTLMVSHCCCILSYFSSQVLLSYLWLKPLLATLSNKRFLYKRLAFWSAWSARLALMYCDLSRLLPVFTRLFLRFVACHILFNYCCMWHTDLGPHIGVCAWNIET